MQGKVYLVGAGPGDEELITLKGIRAIKEADVILYDRLANEKLLERAKEKTELIYVGKKSKKHHKSQKEINQLLINKAKKGKIVTRLKGGDPFIFGRGGEEAQILNKNNIKFEIVPGITSPIAVPAYAGIPLTKRKLSSSVGIVTGHESPTKEESSVNWKQLAQSVETLVILMGVGKLSQIVKKLIEAGKDRETPIALIRWGTRSNQKTITGTLEDIVEKVKRANFQPPAVIIVGEIINLREKLNWFENKALFGKNVVVTRPVKQADSFARMLSREGANPLKLPSIKIMPPDDYQTMDKCIKNLDKYDWCIFTSVNGVKYFMNRLYSCGLDVRAFGGVKLCAIGSKTAAALKKHGLVVDYVPEQYVSEAIIEGFSNCNIEESNFLLPRADIARKKLENKLKNQGAEVDNIIAYQTVKAGNNEKYQKLTENRIDMITFTSSSTVNNFMEGVKESSLEVNKFMNKVSIACIGPITAGTVEDYGFKVDVTADEHTVEGLLEEIKKYYELR